MKSKRKWAWRAVGTELVFGLWPVAELAKDEAEYAKLRATIAGWR